MTTTKNDLVRHVSTVDPETWDRFLAPASRVQLQFALLKEDGLTPEMGGHLEFEKQPSGLFVNSAVLAFEFIMPMLLGGWTLAGWGDGQMVTLAYEKWPGPQLFKNTMQVIVHSIGLKRGNDDDRPILTFPDLSHL